jgi:hypothetical protein
MKIFAFIFVLYPILSFSIIYAQEVAPLQLGNYWIYDSGPSTNLGKITVVDTNVVIDSVAYYKLEGSSNYDTTKWYRYSRLREDGYFAIRLDTSYPASNHEKLYWKKNTIIGDSWENYAPDFPLVYTVLDTFVATVFGGNCTIKHLEIDGSLVLFDEYWTEEFGKMSRSDYGGLLESLQGCVIDGVAYGDTSFTVVNVKKELDNPKSFVLTQNYPNPFNPSTTIEFKIPSFGFVLLKIYDILGREVITLVSGEKQAGIYKVQFDGSSLSSGFYFYQLKAGNYVETKKMILEK